MKILGYKTVDKQYVIDEETFPIVKRILKCIFPAVHGTNHKIP